MATTAKRKKSTADNPWPERLRAFRREQGLTQVQASARLGIKRRAWITWETGERPPDHICSRLLEQFLRHPEEFQANGE